MQTLNQNQGSILCVIAAEQRGERTLHIDNNWCITVSTNLLSSSFTFWCIFHEPAQHVISPESKVSPVGVYFGAWRLELSWTQSLWLFCQQNNRLGGRPASCFWWKRVSRMWTWTCFTADKGNKQKEFLEITLHIHRIMCEQFVALHTLIFYF